MVSRMEKHRLTNVDREGRTADCSVCGPGVLLYVYRNGGHRCAGPPEARKRFGSETHRLSNKDTENRTAICSVCGPVEIMSKGNGWRCRTARKKFHKAHRLTVGKTCERCGFVPEHPCQLDVHKHREEINRRETLCANCHRLVTMAERGKLVMKKKRVK